MKKIKQVKCIPYQPPINFILIYFFKRYWNFICLIMETIVTKYFTKMSLRSMDDDGARDLLIYTFLRIWIEIPHLKGIWKLTTLSWNATGSQELFGAYTYEDDALELLSQCLHNQKSKTRLKNRNCERICIEIWMCENTFLRRYFFKRHFVFTRVIR